jgi:hypothetical protein
MNSLPSDVLALVLSSACAPLVVSTPVSGRLEGGVCDGDDNSNNRDDLSDLEDRSAAVSDLDLALSTLYSSVRVSRSWRDILVLSPLAGTLWARLARAFFPWACLDVVWHDLEKRSRDSNDDPNKVIGLRALCLCPACSCERWQHQEALVEEESAIGEKVTETGRAARSAFRTLFVRTRRIRRGALVMEKFAPDLGSGTEYSLHRVMSPPVTLLGGPFLVFGSIHSPARELNGFILPVRAKDSASHPRPSRVPLSVPEVHALASCAHILPSGERAIVKESVENLLVCDIRQGSGTVLAQRPFDQDGAPRRPTMFVEVDPRTAVVVWVCKRGRAVQISLVPDGGDSAAMLDPVVTLRDVHPEDTDATVEAISPDRGRPGYFALIAATTGPSATCAITYWRVVRLNDSTEDIDVQQVADRVLQWKHWGGLLNAQLWRGVFCAEYEFGQLSIGQLSSRREFRRVSFSRNRGISFRGRTSARGWMAFTSGVGGIHLVDLSSPTPALVHTNADKKHLRDIATCRAHPDLLLVTSTRSVRCYSVHPVTLSTELSFVLRWKTSFVNDLVFHADSILLVGGSSVIVWSSADDSREGGNGALKPARIKFSR